MSESIKHPGPCCGRSRRAFLSDLGMGFTGLALGAMLAQDGVTRADSTAAAPSAGVLGVHGQARAKSVIWIFLSGGYSHLETFDPKPALNQYAGMTFDKTPFENPVNSPLHKKRFRSVAAEEINVRDVYPTIYPMQVGWKKHGQSGIEMTDWWPHLAKQIDELCFVRNMWTTDNDHAAENQIHTGRHRLDEQQPSLGAWAHYGLGTLNENLPKFAVLGGPTRSDTRWSIDSLYLGPQHSGVPLALDPKNPLPFSKRFGGQSFEQQRKEYELISRLNGLTGVEYPEDQQLQARIRAYELAFRMQSSVPEAVDLAQETKDVQELYGLHQEATKVAGERLLAARRLVERGVRFVQVYPSAYGVWDSHQKLQENHTRLCGTVDLPVAGLIKDLKQRGMMKRRWWSSAPSLVGHRDWNFAVAEPRAATITRTGSPSGWPERGSRRVTSTARRTNLAITLWAKDITSPTSTRPCSICWVSTVTGWSTPDANGWRSTTAMSSTMSSPEGHAEWPIGGRGASPLLRCVWLVRRSERPLCRDSLP